MSGLCVLWTVSLRPSYPLSFKAFTSGRQQRWFHSVSPSCRKCLGEASAAISPSHFSIPGGHCHRALPLNLQSWDNSGSPQLSVTSKFPAIADVPTAHFTGNNVSVDYFQSNLNCDSCFLESSHTQMWLQQRRWGNGRR